MPSPRVYITVSRSGQTLSPCTQMSSAVLATTVTRVSAPVRSTSRSRPCRKRAPPTPPESTVRRGGGGGGFKSGVSDISGGASRAWLSSVDQLSPIPDFGLTSWVRQACNHTSVISNSVRQDRRVEEGRTLCANCICSTETAGRRRMAGARSLRSDRSGGLLPREGRLHQGGQEGLPDLRRTPGLPGVRPGERRALRHLGRALGARAPQAEEAGCLTPDGCEPASSNRAGSQSGLVVRARSRGGRPRRARRGSPRAARRRR